MAAEPSTASEVLKAAQQLLSEHGWAGPEDWAGHCWKVTGKKPGTSDLTYDLTFSNAEVVDLFSVQGAFEVVTARVMEPLRTQLVLGAWAALERIVAPLHFEEKCEGEASGWKLPTDPARLRGLLQLWLAVEKEKSVDEYLQDPTTSQRQVLRDLGWASAKAQMGERAHG